MSCDSDADEAFRRVEEAIRTYAVPLWEVRPDGPGWGVAPRPAPEGPTLPPYGLSPLLGAWRVYKLHEAVLKQLGRNP